MQRRSQVLAITFFGLALAAGCSTEKKVFEQYTKAGTQSEQARSGTDAEGFYVSALERARASLGKVEQSDALYNLGAFYRREARFAEAERAMTESLALARESGRFDDLAIGRRQLELARDLAALNRWHEGAPALRTLTPLVTRYPADEAADIRLLAEVYRERLATLGMDPRGLPE